ncbi:MAG: hypothetical protein ACRDBH_05005 [Bosea sp. (in: a-proteobacteria)]
MSLDAFGSSGGAGSGGGFAAAGVDALRCDGGEIQLSDRLVTAPVGTYVTGYTTNQNAANGCVTLADDYYDAATRAWTGGRNFLANNATGTGAWVGNGTSNVASVAYVAIAAGQLNQITGGSRSFIGAGQSNRITAPGSYHAILAGLGNTISTPGAASSILGGNANQITAGNYNSILGGNANIISTTGAGWFASGYFNQILGGGSYGGVWGYNNFANGTYLTVSGVNNGTAALPITGNGRWDGNANTGGGGYLDVSGQSHNVTGSYNAVHGLASTVASSYNIVGGYNHNVSQFGNAAFGYQQTITANRSIGVGQSNTVGGGTSNAVFGSSNVLAGRWNSLVAGESNNVNGQYTGIVGGYFNVVAANSHVVTVLGQQNNISATVGLVNGGATAIGYGNELRSGLTPVAIGYGNIVSGNYSMAIGRQITNLVADSVVVAGAGQRLGFYGVAPVLRATLPAAATNAATTQTLVNAIRTALINLGLTA